MALMTQVMSCPRGVLGSGRGRNAGALLKAEQNRKRGGAQIAALVSDQHEAGILELGTRFSALALYLDPGQAGARLSEAAEDAYIERINTFSPRLIVLAGFMRIIGPRFIEAFQGRVLNLHPSRLPSFKGAHGSRAAFAYGVKVTGCTVHWVNPQPDDGPDIGQNNSRSENADNTPQHGQT